MGNVRKIPPQIIVPQRLRGAAYCRVSPKAPERLASLAAQERHYEDHIKNDQSWEFMGLTPTSEAGRPPNGARDSMRWYPYAGGERSIWASSSRHKQNFRRLSKQGALFRVDRRSWWREELPGETEYATARDALDKAGWAVDYIVTHCCPSSVQDELSGGLYQRDALTDFFEEIRQRCAFKYWFFGHYHENVVIQKRFVLLYEQTIKLKF